MGHPVEAAFELESWQYRHVLLPPRHPVPSASALPHSFASENWCLPSLRSASAVAHFPTDTPFTASLCASAFSRASCHSTSFLDAELSPSHPSALRSAQTRAGHVGHPSFRECFGTMDVWQKRQSCLSPTHPGTLPIAPSPQRLSSNWYVPAALSAGTFWQRDVTEEWWCVPSSEACDDGPEAWPPPAERRRAPDALEPWRLALPSRAANAPESLAPSAALARPTAHTNASATVAWDRMGGNGEERVCQDRALETSGGHRDVRTTERFRNHRTTPNRRGDRSARALREPPRRRRTRGSRPPSPSAGKSCRLRACAPAVKTATRHPRARSREPPSPRDRASGSRPSSDNTSAALEGEGMATARARPTGGSLDVFDARASVA